MKSSCTMILILLLSNLCFGKNEPVEDSFSIDLNEPVSSYTYELKKKTDIFRLKLNFKAPVKGVSLSYTRNRESDSPLSLPEEDAKNLRGKIGGSELVVMKLTDLAPGDVYHVRIKYYDPAEHSVDLELRVPARSFWTVSYGNNLVFNNSLAKDPYQEYFLKEGAPGTYTILSKEGNALSYAPSLNFMNLQYTKGPIGFAYGASLGLETNSATPTASMGIGAHFGYQVQLLGGFVMHQLPGLRPEYSLNEQLTSLLTADQLTRNSYRGSLFVSLSIRFDKNPRQ
jgi:hypothetical protein